MPETIPPYRCRCRLCGKIYREDRATADWKGYCSQACLHEMARKHGYKKRNAGIRSEYDVLSRAEKIGSVYVDFQGCVI